MKLIASWRAALAAGETAGAYVTLFDVASRVPPGPQSGPIVREALEVLAAAPEDGSFAAERQGLTSRLRGALRSVP